MLTINFCHTIIWQKLGLDCYMQPWGYGAENNLINTEFMDKRRETRAQQLIKSQVNFMKSQSDIEIL